MKKTINYATLLKYHPCDGGRIWFLENFDKDKDIPISDIEKILPTSYRSWAYNMLEKLSIKEREERYNGYNRLGYPDCDCLCNGNYIYYKDNLFYLVSNNFEYKITKKDLISLLQCVEIMLYTSLQSNHGANSYYIKTFLPSYDTIGDREYLMISKQLGVGDGVHICIDKADIFSSHTFSIIRPRILLSHLLGGLK